ncbi:helix-turn-helix transcriptional regulator [Streptomyces venezuelae]|uniref:Helix-turn-helix transcriptional regulator n=1 Tax=Streptomyces venezuelae TaxID=54571 RepID=A0A5P2C3C4_STRVZ|nr:LuxR C-terminal-related transcriptional regulator [Streptomyces venezuelae]QES35159.1 helix-turn-helix transcriptional regulator [Streptomyces venezuelae]
MATKRLPHAVEELCEAGLSVYARAVSEGRIHRSEAGAVPCLVELGLLRSDLDDRQWLRPGSLPAPHDGCAAHLPASEAAAAGSSITVLDGISRINSAIDRAMKDVRDEFLAVQPGGTRPPETLAEVFPRDQALLTRGCRMRTLYQHTTRHSLPVLAYFEQLDGDIEARTLDEVTDRLFVFDRTVAFVPASKDRSIALELRHPALVEYFATTFWRLWRLATPMWPQAAPQPSEGGITTRQRAIAGLLVEGLTDAEIADRLGMNIRTARVHIAKLAATLGSHSRAQLGFLIARSGLLNQQG